MRMNQRDTTGRMPYEYKADINWARYTAFIIDPVDVYGGADSQFEKISEEDKENLAMYMQAMFTEKLSKRFRNSVVPGSETLRIKLTLTGAKANTNVLNTVMHFDLLGGPTTPCKRLATRRGCCQGR